MAELMLRMLVVGAAVTAAAFLFERALVHLRLGRRHAWTFALLATGLLPFVPSMFMTGVAEAIPVLTLPALVVSATSQLEASSAFNSILLAWLMLSAVVLAVYALAFVRLRRARRTWRTAAVAGQDVYVSETFGPAVFGFRRPRIVVPHWVLEADAEQGRMIVLHESEHIAARDQWQLLLALAATAALPWHPLVWLQALRLRFAVEADCDQRVLAQLADHGGYASLLVDVGARQTGLLLTPALAEHRNGLEKRLRIMTVRLLRNRWRAAFMMLAGVALTVVACDARLPHDSSDAQQPSKVAGERMRSAVVPTPADAQTLPLRRINPQDGPQFTPHTTKPELRNREEVARALVRAYPAELRDNGVSGMVMVWLLIDEQGQVMRAQLQAGSGERQLDDAALDVARRMLFTPAEHEGRRVPVWIALPVVFKTN